MLIPCLYDRQSCSRAPDENKLLTHVKVIYTSYQKHNIEKTMILRETNPCKSFIAYTVYAPWEGYKGYVLCMCYVKDMCLMYCKTEYSFVFITCRQVQPTEFIKSFLLSWPISSQCVRYCHCKDSENKLVTCATNRTSKL